VIDYTTHNAEKAIQHSTLKNNCNIIVL